MARSGKSISALGIWIRAQSAALLLSLAACGPGHPPAPRAPVPTGLYHGGDAGGSRAADHVMLTIPEGPYTAGSTPEERDQAYADYRNSAHSNAAQKGHWFAREEPRHHATLTPFRIDLTEVTNAAYAEFVADTKAPAPTMDRATWKKQGFSQDYDTEVVRMIWKNDQPPAGREDHPVVLVTWAQARGYCAWRGAVVGEARRLPTAAEYEKAARGQVGLVYPWGNDWDPSKLNTQASGPDDTMAAGSFPDGASPYGMLDAAGNVFQWTSTPWPYGKGRMTVKGSAWDDFGGVGRGASRHGRRATIRHVIVGFRCAADAP